MQGWTGSTEANSSTWPPQTPEQSSRAVSSEKRSKRMFLGPFKKVVFGQRELQDLLSCDSVLAGQCPSSKCGLPAPIPGCRSSTKGRAERLPQKSFLEYVLEICIGLEPLRALIMNFYLRPPVESYLQAVEPRGCGGRDS